MTRKKKFNLLPPHDQKKFQKFFKTGHFEKKKLSDQKSGRGSCEFFLKNVGTSGSSILTIISDIWMKDTYFDVIHHVLQESAVKN